MPNKANPILVEIYRENILESFHRGVICIVNEWGEIIYSIGNPQQICYPRSALKFFQQIFLVESGAADYYQLTEEELAITCGSHNGEARHVNIIRKILNKARIDENLLHCGPQPPTRFEDQQLLWKQGLKPGNIHNNCSGKHSGFLLASKYLGYDISTYWKADHPLQLKIKQIVAEMHEYPIESMVTALDGCSAPIYSIPVYNQAIGYKNLSTPEKYHQERASAIQRLTQAAMKFPFMIAGSQRYCTDLMEAYPMQILGKTGAEGIFSIMIPSEKIGLTIKIDDGKMNPQYTIAQYILENFHRFKFEPKTQLEKYIHTPLYNFNKYKTGYIKPADGLIKGM